MTTTNNHNNDESNNNNNNNTTSNSNEPNPKKPSSTPTTPTTMTTTKPPPPPPPHRRNDNANEIDDEHPTKIKVSHKDVFQHLAILGTIFLFIMFKLAFDSPSHGDEMARMKQNNNKQESLSDTVETLMKVLTEGPSYTDPPIPSSPRFGDRNDDERDARVDHHRSATKCRIYLAQSSIRGSSPDSHLGLFTSVPLRAGEVLFHGPSLPFASSQKEEWMSPYLPLLRHHHLYANVDVDVVGGGGGAAAGDESAPIAVSRDVEAGEELFFHLRDLPTPTISSYAHQNFHPNLPTRSTFEEADRIVQNILNSIPMKETVRTNRNYRRRRRTETVTVSPLMDSTPVLKMVKDLLVEYDPVLASVLPERNVEARSMMGIRNVVEEGGGEEGEEKEGEVPGSARYLSNRRGNGDGGDWVRNNGVCVDGVVLARQRSSGSGVGGAYASRDVAVGEVVVTAPVFVMRMGEGEDGSVEDMRRYCFGSGSGSGDGSTLLICPMSYVMWSQHGGSGSDDRSKECIDDVKECQNDQEDNGGTANAYYQWSEMNSLNDSLGDIQIDDLINKATGLTIDFIAKRNIVRGEEIFIDYDLAKNDASSMVSGAKDFAPNLKDGMLPSHWA